MIGIELHMTVKNLGVLTIENNGVIEMQAPKAVGFNRLSSPFASAEDHFLVPYRNGVRVYELGGPLGDRRVFLRQDEFGSIDILEDVIGKRDGFQTELAIAWANGELGAFDCPEDLRRGVALPGMDLREVRGVKFDW